MSLKYTVVLLCVICLSYKVVITGCDVVLVNRNVTDSFRVGQDGCTNDGRVCTDYGTACRQSDGLCLCPAGQPNFRRPTRTKAYGCLISADIRAGVGLSGHCVFATFQPIPYMYSQQDSATQFNDVDNPNVALESCSLNKAKAKFPDQAEHMKLQWLNESYVDLTIANKKTLHFKWNRSVPSLRGTIITLSLFCTLSSETSVVPKCLRAKVLGTWPADENPTDLTPVATAEPTTPTSLTAQSTKSTASDDSSTDDSSNNSMATSPTSSARTSPPGEVSRSDDDDSSGTIIIIAVVVPVVLLIVLVVVVWCLRKRKNRYSQRNSSDGRSSKKNGTARLKQFRHTDSNLRGPDAYEDGQTRDTNEKFVAQANHGYSRPDSQRVVVEANPMYATPDIKRKEDKSANYNPPGYEPVNMKKREYKEDDSQADPGYATPDVNRREINRVNSYPEPGYETPDIKKKEINVATADSAYSTPEENNADIERIDVNGDLYALPDKNKSTKKINGLNYMDPSRLISGSQYGNESQDQSGQPTEYAEVVGVMKAAPKKTKKKK